MGSVPMANVLLGVTGSVAAILTPALYAMMVVMALVTTMATAPALAWLRPEQAGVEGPCS